MFPCKNCGLCCKNIGVIEELKEYDLGNGVCKYLDEKTNLCKIYENRPLVCRVDEMYKMFFKDKYSLKEFYIINAKICNQLQEEVKLDKSFRINIENEIINKL